jgi:GT2 family glycosyltransferase
MKDKKMEETGNTKTLPKGLGGKSVNTQKIAVLIPVHNGLEYTRQCIEALNLAIGSLQDLLCQYTIFIIDDGSTDGTSRWVRRHHPGIILLEGDGFLWWSGSVKKGARDAIEKRNFDWVLLWNNDIVPDKSYFAYLSKRIVELKKDTIVGSKVCDINRKNETWSMGGFYNPITGKKYMLGLDKDVSHQEDAIIEPDWLTGMGTLIHRKVFQKIGYWNEIDFPQYFGDMDFTYRARKNGIRLIVDPRLVIYNDTRNTGSLHEGSFRKLIRSLFSIRSKYNLGIEVKFHHRHAISPLIYFYLFYKYFRYLGGFFKWKVIAFVGGVRNTKGNETCIQVITQQGHD